MTSNYTKKTILIFVISFFFISLYHTNQKKIMKKLLYLFIILSLTSCATKKYCPQAYNRGSFDNVYRPH